MRVAAGSDHAGYPLKLRVIEKLREAGHEVIHPGTDSTDPVDYPDYACAVARAICAGRAERAVPICGSGDGASAAATKFLGIRAATGHDSFSARRSVGDDDVNASRPGRVRHRPRSDSRVGSGLDQCNFWGADGHRRRLGIIATFEAEFGN